MRLPWPFSRFAAAGADHESPSTDGADRPIASAPERPRSTGAWASLPPIQRAVGPAPLVASAETFFDAVPGVHPLPPIVEPLGHDVTPVAPAGLVAASVHAVPSLTSATSLVPPPVQRRAEAAAEATTSTETATATSDDGPTGAPIRQLGVVPPAEAARPPDRPLTRADPPAAPPRAAAERPLVSRRMQVPAAAETAAPAVTQHGKRENAAATAPPDVPVVARRRAGLGAPVPEVPPTAVSNVVPRALAELALPRPAPASAPPGSGPAPTGSRSSTTSPLTGTAPLRSTIQRRTAGPRGAEPDDTDGPDGTASGADPETWSTPAAMPSPAPLPVLRVVADRRSGGEPAGAGDGHASPANGPISAGHASSDTPAVRHRTGSTPAGPGAASERPGPESQGMPVAQRQRRPLAGARPIGSGNQLQRSTDDDGQVHPAAGPAPATASPPAAGGVWALPGLAGLPATSGPAWPGADIGRRHDTGNRPTWPARPAGGTPSSPPSMALARSAAPPSVQAIGSSSGGPTVAGSIASDGPQVQASAAAATPPPSAPVFGPTATPIIQRVDGSAPPTPPDPNPARSDDELDQLARAIFGRLRNRLRNEYIFEREAKGLTFDQS